MHRYRVEKQAALWKIAAMESQSVTATHQQRIAAYVEMLPEIGALQIFGQHAFVAACLSALARSRVADFVDGQRNLEQVASAAQINLPVLTRILRFLEPQALFESTDGRFSLTKKGRLLRSDSPIFSALFVRGANDAASGLDHSLKTGQSAFTHEFGQDFWSFLSAHPDQQAAFADIMRLGSSMFALACIPVMDFSGVKSIADIGGGTGDLLAAILEANPSMQGILVDLPEMLARAHPALASGALSARCKLQPGDLFENAPRADAYILSQVLHNWDDKHAARILRNLRHAAPPTARLLIITMIIPQTPGDHPAKLADIGMLTLFGQARERTEQELRNLLQETGWQPTHITPTKIAAVITANAA